MIVYAYNVLEEFKVECPQEGDKIRKIYEVSINGQGQRSSQ